MKTKDLMIGDWVRRRWTCTGTGREVVKDFQVAEIRKYGETLYVWSKGGNMGAVEEIEPIPLTPEILAKNEWELVCREFSDDIECGLNHNGFRITIYTKYGYTIVYKGIFPVLNNVHLHSVHELQHALRLCGIDKEIEL